MLEKMYQDMTGTTTKAIYLATLEDLKPRNDCSKLFSGSSQTSRRKQDWKRMKSMLSKPARNPRHLPKYLRNER